MKKIISNKKKWLHISSTTPGLQRDTGQSGGRKIEVTDRGSIFRRIFPSSAAKNLFSNMSHVNLKILHGNCNSYKP